MREGGFEGICFSITNETFWSNSATCSCTVELREVVHFRGFFFQISDFWQILQAAMGGGGAQHAVLRVNELKKTC